MEYTCTRNNGTINETWTGRICLLSWHPEYYEAEINGRGTYFHVIAGRHQYGNYLCIPNHNLGSELSDFQDLFWNTRRLSGLMKKVDAVTVATGLYYLEQMVSSV